MANFFKDYFDAGDGPSQIKTRNLGDRSKLRFMYPKIGDRGSITTGTTITLPFFENIDITESQKARLGKHDIIGRNGQMFTHMGAQSRSINLDFIMTFPHISASNPHSIQRYISGDGGTYQSKIKENMKNGVGGRVQGLWGISGMGMKHTTNIVQWWTDVVRTSTLNSGKDPRLGPPLIMLKHGPLYQDAKFICQGYNISFDQEAGMELPTLMSRRVLISMSLLEVKFGNGYEPGKNSTTGDALTGWQDLLDHGMMDPANDLTPAMAKPGSTYEKDQYGRKIEFDAHGQEYHRPTGPLPGGGKYLSPEQDPGRGGWSPPWGTQPGGPNDPTNVRKVESWH